MFVRASRRSLQNDAFKQSSPNYEVLHLPFLCPALFTLPNHRRKTSTRSQPWSNAELKQPRASVTRRIVGTTPQNSRSLASAAAATVEYDSNQDYHIPWEPTQYLGQHPSSFKGQSNSTLRSFDPHTSPIIINDTLSTHPKKFRSVDAVSGDINEIHQTLHACLQVGRLERAAGLVRRLNQIYKPDAPGLLAAHNDYVKELSHRIVVTSDQQLLQGLQRWFEVELCGAGVTPTEVTYALMIQASLQASDVKKARTVRRYVGLAEKAGLGEETMNLLSALQRTGVADANATSTVTSQPIPESTQPLSQAAVAETEATHTVTHRTEGAMPEVRMTPQKGHGLSTLKKALASFPNPATVNPTDYMNRTIGENEDRQRALERNTLEAAMERWQAEDAHLKSIGVNSGLSSSTIGAMMWQWHEKLIPRIKDEIRKSHEAENKQGRNESDEDRLLWAPYLQSLPPDKISAVTILAAMKCTATDVGDERGLRLQYIVLQIGDAIQDECLADRLRNNKSLAHWRVLANITNASTDNKSLAKLAKESVSQAHDHLDWEKATRIRLGAVLLSHLMDIAKVQVSREDPDTNEKTTEIQPVFFHTYQYVAGKRVGVVRLNSAVLERLTKSPVTSAIAKCLPMITVPKPWVGYREGGFLEHSIPVVRVDYSDMHAKRYAIAAAENGDMSQIFAGLDVLGKTPWKINRFVFDTMLKVWNTGEAFAKIPPEDSPSEFPEAPPPSDDPTARAAWMRRQREFHNHRSGLKSQRCFQNFQIEVARAYLNETFYFPHNVDFRGRAYPLAPFMNHMGSDNCRGLLMFAEGKELTSAGLWWLKVHLANVYGYDKASFAERLQFTEDHRAEIYESVNNPIGGSRWWLDAEDPWQCLAACKELTSALDSPDPARYVCQLPIHQDGTCNGLQHYAALGGDVAGAQQVNLEPGECPSDVYTGVAEIVKAKIAEHALQGHELAKALEGKITRKIVKQTVMTNVYGVTFVGARRQVQSQLDDLFPDFPDRKTVNRRLAASYIAKEIFKGLSSMFTGAHDIQYWLTECAGRISESIAPEQVTYIRQVSEGLKKPSLYKTKNLKGTPKNDIAAFKSGVVWTTPLRMPVVQPYRKESSRRIQTHLQNISIIRKSAADPVHKTRQVQAFPPNFIHSLDATHMFLTALKCDEVGLTFASIHDSFWTHPGDVNTMNRIIRDAFIRMHSEDIIGRLAAEFRARYKNFMHLASIPIKSQIGQKVSKWRRDYYREQRARQTVENNSKKLDGRKWNELLLEHRRLTLLASGNPEEQEQGRKMMTPGRIFDEAADETALAPTDVKIATLGGTSRSNADSSARSAKLKANQQLEIGDLENGEVAETATGEKVAAAAPEADPETPEDAEAVADKDDPEDMEVTADEDEEPDVKAEQKKKKKACAKVWLWLPLKFPPVPKKGDFDVTRLRNSQYFFS